MTAKPSETLMLFSSDNRPLYLADCLAVIAAPKGAVQRFRYRRGWVSLTRGSQPTDAEWKALATKKVAVEVYFLAAKSRNYGRAVYIPLRSGKVVRAFTEGDFLFLDFELGGYLTFSADDSEISRQEAAIELTDGLRASLGTGRFPEADYGAGHAEGKHSVVLSTAAHRTTVSDFKASAQFVQISKFLDDLLTAGDSHPTFMRWLGVRPAYPAAAEPIVMKNGSYGLSSATAYRVDILQVSASTPKGVSVGLVLPAVLSTSSDTTANVTSPYDVTTFTFVSAAKENDNRGEMVASVSGSAGGFPDTEVRVPVLVKPRRLFGFLNWAVVIGSLVGTFLLALASLKGVIWEVPAEPSGEIWNWTIAGHYFGVYPAALATAAFAALASSAAAAGAVFRRRVGLDSK